MSKANDLAALFGNDGIVAQGKDGSEILASQKNYSISIGLPRINRLLKFKSFVTDFSRSSESGYEEEGFALATSPRAIKGPVKNDITISFDIPSVTLNEGRINLRKIQDLSRVFLSEIDNLNKFSHNPEYYVIYVCFSNFISKAGVGAFDPENYEAIRDNGEKCIFKNFSFEIDVGAGFYEGDKAADPRDQGKFIPKKLSVTMELTPIINNLKQDNKKGTTAHILPRFVEDKKDNKDIAFPFGIDFSR